MVTSSPIALALGMEKASPDIMQQPPRSKATTLFTKDLVIDTFVYGAIMGSLSLSAFIAASAGESPWKYTSRCYTHDADIKSACKGIYAARYVTFWE
jgi:magnesium-transporting ATPase (P-type)